jgi:hypothetical protein
MGSVGRLESAGDYTMQPSRPQAPAAQEEIIAALAQQVSELLSQPVPVSGPAAPAPAPCTSPSVMDLLYGAASRDVLMDCAANALLLFLFLVAFLFLLAMGLLVRRLVRWRRRAAHPRDDHSRDEQMVRRLFGSS